MTVDGLGQPDEREVVVRVVLVLRPDVQGVGVEGLANDVAAARPTPWGT
jgi:hypothetical protein